MKKEQRSITLPGEIIIMNGEPCVFTGFVERTDTNKRIVAQVVRPDGSIAEHPIFFIGACRGSN